MQERDSNWWKGYYGKEPFDLRLTVLRVLAGLPVIAAVTLLGMLVFGGGYYIKNVLLREEDPYAAVSVYHVEYAVEDEKDVGTVFINETSWNTYLQSELFLKLVQEKLQKLVLTEDGWEALGETAGYGAGPGISADPAYVSELQGMEAQELAGMLEAHLESDLRMPFITVTSESAEKCVLASWAVERVMTQDFADEIREVLSIEVVDPGDEAFQVAPDVRVGRAFILSAVLSCFFAVVALLLKETGDDSIWLPSTLWRRYGLRTLGTIKSRELQENMNYFFAGSAEAAGVSQERKPQAGETEAGCAGLDRKKRIAVCMVQEKLAAEEVLSALQNAWKAGAEAVSDRKAAEDMLGGEKPKITWFAVESPISRPEGARKLREADGILLVVKAGKGAGRKLEHVLEYLEQQECAVTAALLWGADETLIRRYGGF